MLEPLMRGIDSRRNDLRRTGVLLLSAALVSVTACLLGCGGVTIGGIAADRVDGLHGAQVYSTRQGYIIEVDELVQSLREADYVLLGEVHDDPQHHALQHLLLNEIVRDGRKPAVVFEMFTRSEAPLIATTRRRSPDDPDAIASAVHWTKSGRPDWALYRPIVDTALAAGLPIQAGNVSRNALRDLIVLNGWQGIDKHILDAYGMPDLLPHDAEQKKRQSLAEENGGNLPPRQVVENVLREQHLRQASIADAMLAGHSGDGAVLIAAREYADLDYGVPRYLKYREPDTAIASVAFVDTSAFVAGRHAADGFAPAHDFVWLVPSSATSDTARH